VLANADETQIFSPRAARDTDLGADMRIGADRWEKLRDEINSGRLRLRTRQKSISSDKGKVTVPCLIQVMMARRAAMAHGRETEACLADWTDGDDDDDAF
jgi:hypothetical protein